MDPLGELEKVAADFGSRLAEQEAKAREREETLRAEHRAELEAARQESERRLAEERKERQAGELRLRKALEDAAAREDAREQSAPPVVGSASPGVALFGYLQADYQWRQSSEDQLSSSGQTLNQDRFLLRRARLGVTLERTYEAGRLEIDGNTVNGTALRLVGAEASAKLPGSEAGAPALLVGTLGMFRIPFGKEVAEDDRYRLFMERSMAARALFPGEYDLGARLSGAWHFVRYVLAVQNGQPIGSSFFPALDPNHQKDILGRVGIAQVLTNVAITGGFSGLRGTGFHAGALATKPSVQWNDLDESGTVGQGEITGAPGTAASSSASFTRIAFGADFALSVRLSERLRTRLAAELYWADDLDRGALPADPQGVAGRSYRELGYYVSLVQEYGRWHLGARYDYYNPDQDANKVAKGEPVVTNASYSTLAVAAACTAAWGRFVVEYEHNRNHLGLNPAGMPANLADDAVILRGEVVF